MKNRTLSFALAAVLALSVSGPAFANQEGKEGMNPEKKLDHMKKELKLSDEQSAQVKSILDSSKAEFEKLRTQMKALIDKNHQEIAAVLTPEQKAKFEEMKEKFKHGKSGWGKHQEKSGEETGEKA